MRSAAARRNGSNSSATRSGGTTAPELLTLSELPDPNPPSNGPPPVNRWSDRDPAAAARLIAARTATASIAGQHKLPVENLLQPELVRRLCWEPPPAPSVEAVAETLRIGGARPWQIELTADALTLALRSPA